MWRDIPGWPYQASKDGRIRHRVSGRERVKSPHPQGYEAIQLYDRGYSKNYLVHQLVALAFIGECPLGHEVNHINGVKTDNRAENLEYKTRPENIAHAMATGLNNLFGEANPSAKLTAEIVREVRRAYAAGEGGYKVLGVRFGVNPSHIRSIVKGRLWRNLDTATGS